MVSAFYLIRVRQGLLNLLHTQHKSLLHRGFSLISHMKLFAFYLLRVREVLEGIVARVVAAKISPRAAGAEGDSRLV